MNFKREGEILDRIGIGNSQNPIEVEGIYHFIPRVDFETGESYYDTNFLDKKYSKKILKLIESKGLTPFMEQIYGVGKVINDPTDGHRGFIIKEGIIKGIDIVRFSEIKGQYILYEKKKYRIK